MLKHPRVWFVAVVGLLLVASGLVGVWRVWRSEHNPFVSAQRVTPAPELRVATSIPTRTSVFSGLTRSTATPPPDETPTPRETPVPHETLRTVEQAVLPVRDLFDLAVRFGRVSSTMSRVQPSGPYEEGDRETFWIGNIEYNRVFTTTAVLRLKTEHAYWWVEETYEVPLADIEQSAEVFEERIYPTNRTFFGPEWSPGVDGDPRLHVFMGRVPGVGGYFSSADEFPQAVNPFSNQKEIVYINLESVWPGEPAFDAVLAHEFQHMIHWRVDRNEATWVNEGLSELAVRLNDIPVDRSGVVLAFLNDPDIPLTNWTEPTVAAYGASLSFFEYVADRLGREAVRQIVAQPADGLAGIEAVAARAGLTFEALFADWVVANVLGDEPEGHGSRLASRTATRAAPSAHHRVYPVVVEEAQVHQFGADYIVFEPPAGKTGTLEVTFRGRQTVPLVPSAPHSGQFAFWSHRGDEVDTRLTRAFDLTGVSQATLRFWAWYDIERDYDYAYVLVSDDGGRTWQPLAATGTTTANPNGNALGPGYTGVSGCPEEADEPCEPRWVEHTADLTPFTGKRVLVRFEYVTDDALNRDGFLLDDISIPELGYAEDFEADDGGWKAEGWVRVNTVLPQQYLVQAVLFEQGGRHRVVRVSLDSERRGNLTIPGFGREVRRVVLAVSGTTPVTSVPASYAYRATFTSAP